MKVYDLIIIGSGPAGMRTAIDVAQAGCEVIVLDEQKYPGGQIYRAVQKCPPERLHLLGSDYAEGLALVNEFNQAPLTFIGLASVWDIDCESKVITYKQNRGSCSLGYRKLILATGAMERAYPFSGWEKIGVMTAGAGQILLKDAGKVCDKVVIAGSGPLLDLLACQYIKAGIKPLAVVDMTVKKNYLNAAKHFLSALKGWRYLFKGLILRSKIRTSGVRRYSFAGQLQGHGKKNLDAVSFTVSGKKITLKTDHLLVHFGVIPNINLTASINADLYWCERQQCLRPRLSRTFESSVRDVFIVGDGIGIFGANAAQLNGRLLAAYLTGNEKLAELLQKKRQQDIVVRPFLEKLFLLPARSLTELADDTVICRCESVRLKEIKKAVSCSAGALNDIKMATRASMGPCQGRQCGNALVQITAQMTSTPPQEVGYITTRSPVIPVTFLEVSTKRQI
ncbi:NAD(P)/FAD-dependent oxidoreductase [Psychromonas ossibalaenae]|uniref:FAD/NAD(P)-dependent oxidoreductase n=1 Tax=Psychromonas ossibalaenae TaxID=444922 RepID=UPI00037FAF03|nr:FAD/NAD(P)-binding oxidoreductase [Psychromonas ossibalaenae]